MGPSTWRATGSQIWLPCGGLDKTVRVWRLADGSPVVPPLDGSDPRVDAVAVGALPDGTPVIVSAGDESWRSPIRTTYRLAAGQTHRLVPSSPEEKYLRRTGHWRRLGKGSGLSGYDIQL
jgi:hypothetical protein